MPKPTRFPNGVTNVKANDPLRDLPVLSPLKGVEFFDDFLGFTVAASNVTGWHRDGQGTGATVVLDAHGGVLEVTTDTTGGAGSNEHYQWAINADVSEIFKLESGKKAFLAAKFKVSTAAQCLPLIGMHVAADDPWNSEPADQFLFRTQAADRDGLEFAVGKTNSTEVEIALGDLADDTYVEVFAFYDGKDTVHAYRRNPSTGEIVNSGSADVSDTTSGDLLPDTEMTVAFGMETGDTSAADVFTLDYIFAWSER